MKQAKTNMDYWDWVLHNMPDSYRKWFIEEKFYLGKMIAPHSEVLEVGCGDGRSIYDILSLTNKITGIDHDDVPVAMAKNNFSDYPSINILKAEATCLPFKKKTFDYVMCMTTFANFGNKKHAVIEEMKRVLKDDGKIIISVFSEDALEERLKAYSQSGVKINSINKGKVVFENVDKTLGDYVSEQFSRHDLEDIFWRARLTVEDITKVNIAYLCTLKK